MLLGLLHDKVGSELVSLFQPLVFLGSLAAYGLGLFPSVAHGGKPLLLYAVLDEVVHYCLGTFLRQSFVVFGTAFVVAVGTQFDGDIGILLQQVDEFVECLGAGWCERSLVKLVEDVVDEYGSRNGCQGEL